MLKKGKKVLKKGCVFLLVMLAMCLLSNSAFSDDVKKGPRPGETNPVFPNQASLFCDDELLMLVGFPEKHKTTRWSFAPTNADLDHWDKDLSEFQHNADTYALCNGIPSPWAVASGRIAAHDHDQMVQAFFTLDGETQIGLWDFPNRLRWVRLSGSLWSSDSGAIDIEVGDLDRFVDDKGYYHDEIVVARTVAEDSNSSIYKVQVDVLNHNLDSMATASASVPENFNPSRTAVAIGDFDGDSNLEFAVAQMADSTGFQIDVFRLSRDEEGKPYLEKAATYTSGFSRSRPYIDMAAGDFNGDGTDEIAYIISGDTDEVNKWGVHFYDVDLDLNLHWKHAFYAPHSHPGLGVFDVKCVSGLFKFDPENGYGITRRQVAVSIRYGGDYNFIDHFTIYLDDDLIPYEIGHLSQENTTKYGTIGLSAGNFVGHQGDDNSPLMDIAISYTSLAQEPTLKILTPSLVTIYPWTGDSCETEGIRPTAVVAYDKDGDTYRLGPPAHIVINNLIGLDYVIQEPPKHVDYLPTNPDVPEDEWVWDIINVSAYPEFYVEFKYEKEQTVATETKDTSSWAIGGSSEFDVSTTVSGGLGNIAKVSLKAESDTKIGYEYNSSKSSYESEYHSRSVSYASQTNEDDFLHGKFQLLDIWRYPIYGLDTLDADNPYAFQEIILPGPKSTFAGGGRNNADWYQPIHQNRNILSYPSSDDKNFPPDLGSFTLPDGTEVTDIMNEGAVRWWDGGNEQDILVKWTDTAGSGEAKTYNHTLSESEDITIGTSAKASFFSVDGEVEASVKLSFHNTNSWGGSTSEDTKNSESTGIHIHIPHGTGNEQAYKFKSAIYVSSGGGAFKVVHATDPLGSSVGAGWWISQYGRKPDPALNLPNRFEWHEDDYVGNWTLVKKDTRKRMRGFFLRNSEPDPISGEYELLDKMHTDGDVIRVCARVYNFSISQPTGDFGIWWQYVPYDMETGKEIGNRKHIGGHYNLNLDPMEMKEYSYTWDTTGLSEMSEGDSYRLYVIVDPIDTVDEIHEWKDADNNLLAHGNNEGYWPWAGGIIITKPESNTTMALSDVDISMHDESLAVKMPDGIVSQVPVSLTVREHYMLRAHFVSNALHPHYRYALLYDGDPDQDGEVIASMVVRGVVEGDNYVWTEWTPKKPGDYELWVVLLEDSDDPIPGNASDMLSVSVSHPMACCEVNFMKAADKKQGAADDKIKIKGSLKLVQWGESFEPETDVVRVTIDDQVITIPAGSFEAEHTSGLIQYGFKGDIPDVGSVHMRLNFDECRWSIDIRGKDAADIVQNDGASVGLTIGTNVGKDSFEWTRKTKRGAMFNEAPPLLCCPESP